MTDEADHEVDSSFLLLLFCVTTAPLVAATGSTPAPGRRPGPSSPGVARKILPGFGIYPNWAWSWPVNRRVLYNRASCDPEGKPWDPDRRQIWWNEAAQKWAGHDVPDFKPDSNPKDHMGPFIMNPEGVGRLFVPIGAVADGPFPEHYEPIESPIDESPSSQARPIIPSSRS